MALQSLPLPVRVVASHRTTGVRIRALIESEAEAMTARMVDVVLGRNGFETATVKERTRAYEVLMNRAYGAPKQVVETTITKEPSILDMEALDYEELKALENSVQKVLDVPR